MKEYNLFVAGIPYGTTPGTLERCFARAGYSVAISERESSLTPLGSSLALCKGHCVIKAADKHTYHAILGNGDVAIQDRVLICKPFLRGEKLFHQIAVSNKKRVILKGIPSFMDLDSVREKLESLYGRVESMFRFMSDGRSPYDREESSSFSRKISLSVMFIKQQSARTAAQDTYLEVERGYFAVIEAFKTNKKTKNTLGTLGNLRNFGSYHDNIFKEQESKNKEERILIGDPCEILSPGENSLPPGSKYLNVHKAHQSRTVHHLHTCGSPPKRALSLGRKCTENSGIGRFYFTCELLDLSHHLKPTSRVYKLLRREVGEFSAIFELSNTWINRTNLRFNLRRLIE